MALLAEEEEEEEAAAIAAGHTRAGAEVVRTHTVLQEDTAGNEVVVAVVAVDADHTGIDAAAVVHVRSFLQTAVGQRAYQQAEMMDAAAVDIRYT